MSIRGDKISQQPISTRPLSEEEKRIRAKFYESLTTQSDLMDKMSERLLTLELAIPGLYATVLKLVSGDTATLKINLALCLTFTCWLVALLLTLIALVPKKWAVNPDILKQDPHKFSEALGVEDFFEQSALYKRRLATASSLFFFAGIISALFPLG